MRIIEIWTMIQLITTTLQTSITIQRHNNDFYNNNNNNNNKKFPMPQNIGQPSRKESEDSSITNKENESSSGNNTKRSESDQQIVPEKRIVDDAIDFGIKSLQELVEVKEPLWYKLGLVLDERNPASMVAKFGTPNHKALELSRLGYASIEASRKIAETYPSQLARQTVQQLLHDECPIRGVPRCPAISRRYRTPDGTCNNRNRPWRGAALLPMYRFLDPAYSDGIQEPRRSVFGAPLPSARSISLRIHRDQNHQFQTINLLFMQWGQFIDHDITSTVKSRGFNGTIPRCCARGGTGFLNPEFLHPNCLPIEVPSDDWHLGPFGIRCIEFIRSAPSTRINCDLGWREQLNQATSYLDGSNIYGSDFDTSDLIRTFRRGKLQYGRPQNRPLQPPDPPNGELCRSGALTIDCFHSGDGRVSEQPGLTALHTIWVRYHNKLATVLGKLNRHWSDEKIYQETRKIVGAMIQHITYKEFLPIVLGQEVMKLFEIELENEGYYQGYDESVNPAIANSFSTAAFRFGHSLVQNSFVRFDMNHRPLFNNVSLHRELDNIVNIWSFGSLDRMILGLTNQPSQKRDEFICEELTNHLFQNPSAPFGMDLAAINIQRGRDHGLPSYTAWREPCSLAPIKTWTQLQQVMSIDTVNRLKTIYNHVDDIDLFTGGLAEKPVRGGIVGPTFACIIAQQFLNLRKGDRFWYENGGMESSFTPAQLQQIRHITFAHILCQTLVEIETIQPFVFLMPDSFRNQRLNCNDPLINNFDFNMWNEREESNEIPGGRSKRATKKRKTTTKPKRTKTKTPTPLRIPVVNVTSTIIQIEDKEYYNGYTRPSSIPERPSSSYRPQDEINYVVNRPSPSQRPQTVKPLEVNIKIQYYPPTSTTTPKPKKKRRKPTTTTTQRTRPIKTTRPDIFSDSYDSGFDSPYYNRPSFIAQYDQTTKRPYYYQQQTNDQYFYPTSTRRPTTKFPSYLYNRPYKYYDPSDSYLDRHDYTDQRPNFGYVEKISSSNSYDQLDFKTRFIKISSVQGTQFRNKGTVELSVSQREGDLELEHEDKLRLVDLEVIPQESQWKIYNITDKTIRPKLILPTIDFTTETSELPRPIKKRT